MGKMLIFFVQEGRFFFFSKLKTLSIIFDANLLQIMNVVESFPNVKGFLVKMKIK